MLKYEIRSRRAAEKIEDLQILDIFIMLLAEKEKDNDYRQ